MARTPLRALALPLVSLAVRRHPDHLGIAPITHLLFLRPHVKARSTTRGRAQQRIELDRLRIGKQIQQLSLTLIARRCRQARDKFARVRFRWRIQRLLIVVRSSVTSPCRNERCRLVLSLLYLPASGSDRRKDRLTSSMQTLTDRKRECWITRGMKT